MAKRRCPDITTLVLKTGKDVDPETGLTPFEARYAQEWSVCMDNRLAYVRAEGKKYSEKTLRKKISELKGKKEVLLAIDKHLKERSKKVELEGEEVINELKNIALANYKNYFNDDGTPKKISELTINEAAAIKSVDTFEKYEGKGADKKFVGYQTKITFHDKPKALEMLCKNFGILQEQKTGDVYNSVNLTLKVDEAKKLGIDKLKQIANIYDNE